LPRGDAGDFRDAPVGAAVAFAREAGRGATRGIRAFHERLVSHPRLEATLLPLDDGFAVARVKAEATENIRVPD
jgi:Predicted O-methyltransferase